MKAIRPISHTDETVTLRRADFERMLLAIEEAGDAAALRDAADRKNGKGEGASADDLPAESVERVLAGEHPVRIWREHRRWTMQDLAERAGVAPLAVAAIEAHAEPGSLTACRRLATALAVAVDDLLPPEDPPEQG
ncbi:MAG: helix-turn-helix transcriptional regulator [Methylobacterium sp.]|uniref:helix-turn-helix transcriptional regulator n=1 Tax=Methylobacterium sp. TaxID=409 RepID=UPI00258A9ECA|nr:helix-turn-helix transcriptional regulator [Methylobacterium sp.]MBY0298149.1 helix-turn-helix transcriptional regulator [Methylobacterium sp.]